MPDSFSIGPSQAVNPGELAPGQAQQMGVSGGQGSFTSAGAGTFIGDITQDSSSKTLLALTGLAKEMLEPHVQRRETELFFEGMQKAIQGQGMQEVIEEQPGWSNIFGRNSVIRGASAISAMQKVDDFSQYAAEKMPEWRKLSPEQVRKEMLAVLPKMYTGDPSTDMVIQQRMLESVAPLMKHQVKENLKWQGEEYLRKNSEHVVSVGSDIQKRGRELAQNPDSESAAQAFQRSKELLVEKLRRPVGIEESAYEKLFLGTYRQLAQTGNFHAVRMMDKMSDSLGLDPAKMAAAADFADKQEAQFALSAGSLEFGVAAGKLRALWGENLISPKDAADQAMLLNKKYYDAFGLARHPLFSAREIESYTEKSWGKAFRDKEANQKAEAARVAALTDENAKRKAIDDSVTGKVRLYLSGERPTDWKMPGETQVMFDEVLTDRFFKGYNDPKERPAFVNALISGAKANGGYVPPAIKDQLNKGISAGIAEQWTPDFEKSYQMFQELIKPTNAGDVIRTIVGDRTTESMYEYTRLTQQAGIGRDTAYKMAFVTPRPREEWTTKKKEELVSSVDSDLSPWFKFNAPDYTKTQIAEYVTKFSNPIGSYLPPGESRARAGIMSAMAGGMEVVGDFVWAKTKPSDPSFGELVAPGSDYARERFGQPGPLSEAFNTVVRRRAEEAGLKKQLTSVGRKVTGQLDIEGFFAHPLPMQSSVGEDGKLQREQLISITLFHEDGPKVITVSSEEVRLEFKKSAEEDIRNKQPRGEFQQTPQGLRRRYLGITAPETK